MNNHCQAVVSISIVGQKMNWTLDFSFLKGHCTMNVKWRKWRFV